MVVLIAMARGASFVDGYQRRVIDDELDALFPQLPAILLDGPKGVGKTATATQRCVSVRRLDVAAEARVVEADPGVIAADPTPLLIDEWQRVPGTFDAVRRLALLLPLNRALHYCYPAPFRPPALRSCAAWRARLLECAV